MENETLIDYSRQAELDAFCMNQLKIKNHIIVGCGGVGFWTGLMLAMNGCDNFALFDGDSVDRSNLNRLPLPIQFEGHNKAITLRKAIKTLRPDALVTVYPLKLSKEDFEHYMVRKSSLSNVVWDTTDDARIQAHMYKWCRKHRILYVKLGYDGFKTGAYREYSIWFNDETYSPGYRRTVANSMTSAMAACLGIMYMGRCLRIHGNSGVDIGDLEVNIDELIDTALEKHSTNNNNEATEEEDNEEEEEEYDNEADEVYDR